MQIVGALALLSPTMPSGRWHATGTAARTSHPTLASWCLSALGATISRAISPSQSRLCKPCDQHFPELFARLNITTSFLCYKAGRRGPHGLAELCTGEGKSNLDPAFLSSEAARLLEITFAGFVFALTFSCDWASII